MVHSLPHLYSIHGLPHVKVFWNILKHLERHPDLISGSQFPLSKIPRNSWTVQTIVKAAYHGYQRYKKNIFLFSFSNRWTEQAKKMRRATLPTWTWPTSYPTQDLCSSVVGSRRGWIFAIFWAVGGGFCFCFWIGFWRWDDSQWGGHLLLWVCLHCRDSQLWIPHRDAGRLVLWVWGEVWLFLSLRQFKLKESIPWRCSVGFSSPPGGLGWSQLLPTGLEKAESKLTLISLSII